MTLLHKNQFCLSHDKPTSKLNRFEKDVKKFVLLMIIIMLVKYDPVLALLLSTLFFIDIHYTNINTIEFMFDKNNINDLKNTLSNFQKTNSPLPFVEEETAAPVNSETLSKEDCIKEFIISKEMLKKIQDNSLE